MDNQQPQPQPQQPAQIPQPPTIAQKRNWTQFVILAIIAAAILTSGAIYLIISQNKSNKQTASPQTTTTPAEITAEDAQWKKFTDSSHKYSFHYPDTWTLTTFSNNTSKFELRYNNQKKPGLIAGEYLSKEKTSNLILCQVEQTETSVCHEYDITSTTKAFVNLTLKDKKPITAYSFVTRPNDEIISLKITQPNFDSYSALAIILDTLKFDNEPRINKLQVCPDSSNKDTVTYHGAIFPAADIDQEFIKTDCK